MTKAEILASIRYLINENSTDAGALLSDTGNLLDFAYDAAEQVVMDLMPYMSDQFLATETVTLVANQANYTLTNSYLQIYKVERNVTAKRPKEIPVIDQLKKQFYMSVGDTGADVKAVYFIGDTLYCVPTPSAASTGYLRVWEIVPEAAAIPTAGPTYIPRVAHRLIVYWGAYLAATHIGVDPSRYILLYQQRLRAVLKLWHDRYQQEPRFVRESVADRAVYDDREPYLYDLEWPE